VPECEKVALFGLNRHFRRRLADAGAVKLANVKPAPGEVPRSSGIVRQSLELCVRAAVARDYEPLEALVLDSFEPITWQKQLDAQFGPLNGRDWRARWQTRLAHLFTTQVVLVGEVQGELAAMASAAIDREAALAFLDVLAVGRAYQGRGYGRQMLRGAIEHYRKLGCQYVHLDCLSDNDAGNSLYASEGFVEMARHVRWFKRIEE
jgi:ribosomal protein S18 acetylase RimI-like enzyme